MQLDLTKDDIQTLLEAVREYEKQFDNNATLFNDYTTADIASFKAAAETVKRKLELLRDRTPTMIGLLRDAALQMAQLGGEALETYARTFATLAHEAIQRTEPDLKREWNGTPCLHDPDNCWIDSATGEHVNAITNERSPVHPPKPTEVGEFS